MNGPDEDDIALAGEYALGLLEGAGRDAFEARLAAEPALRALVARWHEDLAAMARDVAPVTPPSGARKALEDRLFGARDRRRFLWLAGGAAVAAALGLVAFGPALRGSTLRARVASADGTLVIVATAADGQGALDLEVVAGQARDGRDLELWIILPDGSAPKSLGLIDGAGRQRVALGREIATGLPGATLAVSDEPTGGSPTGAPTGEVLATGMLAPA